MRHHKKWSFLFLSTIIYLAFSCTTTPVPGPRNPLPPEPPVPPITDPGLDNLCEDGVISFYHQVLPIMVASCAFVGCHDAETAEDDVILDTYANILQEVTPGDPNESELYESIIETDPDDIMPPPPAPHLNAEQIATIRQWIEQGALETDCGTPCDVNQTSFQADIYPLVETYCLGCHNDHRTDANVNLQGYDQLLPYVESGSFLSTIKHEMFFPPMPPSGSRLSNCRVEQIENWIAEGAQNN